MAFGTFAESYKLHTMIKYFQTKAQYENKKSSFVKDGDLVFIKDTKDIIFNGVSFADTIREFSYGVRNIQLGDSISLTLSCDYALKSYMNIYSGAARELLYGDRNTTGDVTNNANGFIVLNRHQGNYNSVLFFTPTRLYYSLGDIINNLNQTKGNYKKIAFTDDIPSLESYALKSELDNYITKSLADSSYLSKSGTALASYILKSKIAATGDFDMSEVSDAFCSLRFLGRITSIPELLNNYPDYNDGVGGAVIVGRNPHNQISTFLITNGAVYYSSKGGETLMNTAGTYKRFVFDSDLTSYALKSDLPDLSGYLTKSVADSSYLSLNPSELTFKSGDNSIKVLINAANEFLVNGNVRSSGIVNSGSLVVSGASNLGMVAAGDCSFNSVNVKTTSTFLKDVTFKANAIVEGEALLKGDYTKTGNLWLTYGNLFNLSGDNANEALIINYSCWKSGTGNVAKSTVICDGLNNNIARFTPSSVTFYKDLTVNGSINSTGSYSLDSKKILQASGSDFYISEASDPTLSYWLRFGTYSNGIRKTLVSGDLNVNGELYTTTQHVSGLIYAADSNNTLGIRGKTIIKDYTGNNQIAYFSGSLVLLSSNNTVKLIVSLGSVESTDTFYATNVRIKDSNAEPFMYIYNANGSGYSKLTSNTLRPLNNTFKIDGTLTVNNLSVNDQVTVSGGFVANSWAVMNGLEVTNLTLKNDMTVGGALYSGSIGMKTGNLLNNWYSDELVINFDGLGSSKTTSICDGNYGKIATFASGGITFNQALSAMNINAKNLTVDSLTATSGKILKRSIYTLFTQGDPTSRTLVFDYDMLFIRCAFTDKLRTLTLDIGSGGYRTGDIITVICSSSNNQTMFLAFSFGGNDMKIYSAKNGSGMTSYGFTKVGTTVLLCMVDNERVIIPKIYIISETSMSGVYD